MLLSTAFLPPVSWFAAAAKDFTLSPDRVFPSVVDLEACEHYQKQSWRNRCCIFTANGVESQLVPVVHGADLYHRVITEVQVDYSVPWVTKLERALASAYESAPFFEDYAGGIFAILESRPERLWDLDLQLIRHIAGRIGLPLEIRPTTVWQPQAQDDFRNVIHPKRPQTLLKDWGLEKPYFQVFAGKYGFQSDLSVVDLLFHEGPDSIMYLKSL